MTNSPLDVYSVPSSMAMLQTPTREKSYLLVGLKQGSILTFQLIMSDQGTPNLKLMQDTCFSILNIGTCSVHLTPCLQNDLSIYALSDDLWKISCCDIDKLSTDRVLLPKFNSSVDAFIPLGCDSDSNIYADETAALLVDDKLHIFQLSINAKMNTSKIRLGETPRRVIYDKLLNYIVAITTTSDSGALKSYINLLDPINGQPLTDSSLISNDNHIENSSNTVLSAAGEQYYRFRLSCLRCCLLNFTFYGNVRMVN
ncbi:hypothetical protein BDF20DRAFT_934964 [Mycotypha africana]|uniref:uncharacterized protein n=1 Tax=Mycotypha africana TaxID=64632 RepID=UPI0023017BA1|nr:uncharacterized protein BDF20DRAFT_934964 [Mycotypha africana]KAI8984377.1 hypothetical protein BDF20DRAFT_934964 [Mycotypha africana]